MTLNGHLGFIGEQDLNRNGQRVIKLMEDHNLILFNGDDRCSGETTREESGIKSSIDFILGNKKIYDNFDSMHIDESKEYFDLSDDRRTTPAYKRHRLSAVVGLLQQEDQMVSANPSNALLPSLPSPPLFKQE